MKTLENMLQENPQFIKKIILLNDLQQIKLFSSLATKFCFSQLRSGLHTLSSNATQQSSSLPPEHFIRPTLQAVLQAVCKDKDEIVIAIGI